MFELNFVCIVNTVDYWWLKCTWKRQNQYWNVCESAVSPAGYFPSAVFHSDSLYNAALVAVVLQVLLLLQRGGWGSLVQHALEDVLALTRRQVVEEILWCHMKEPNTKGQTWNWCKDLFFFHKTIKRQELEFLQVLKDLIISEGQEIELDIFRLLRLRERDKNCRALSSSIKLPLIHRDLYDP